MKIDILLMHNKWYDVIMRHLRGTSVQSEFLGFGGCEGKIYSSLQSWIPDGYDVTKQNMDQQSKTL